MKRLNKHIRRFLLLTILFFSNSILYCQTIIYSHNFDNLTGFSTDKAGGFCDASGCSSSDNKYGINSSPSCVSGFDGSTFYARDINSCGSEDSDTLVFPTSLVVPAGEITFTAKVAFDNAGINFSGTNSITFQYSFDSDTGPWNTGSVVGSNSSTSMNCSTCGIVGNLTADAANEITFNMGDGHNGSTLYLRLVVSGFDGASENFFLDDILIIGEDICSLTQATSLSSLLTRTHSVELSWDRGDGDEILVIAREASAIDTDPTSVVIYTANSIFGSGSSVGAAYVVYKGTGTSVTITNLKKCTAYHFAVYEYSIDGANNCYKTPALTGSATTTSRIETYPYSQEFSAVSPCEFSSTDDAWDFAYAALEANYTSASHAGRLSSASSGNGKYIYIETEVEIGYTYELTFQAKRFCDITINTNETPDQISLLSSVDVEGNCGVAWEAGPVSVSYTAEHSGTMYWQILAVTVFGGPTSLYVDDFGISSTLTSLPIELSSFTGKCTRSGLEVNWVSQSELNNHYFTLERANSDLNFEEITQVLGAGNSSNEITYRYIDPSPSFGINYYRLRQTDFDGASEVFPPISVVNSFNDERNSAFFTDNKLTLRFNDLLSDNVGLSLYDVQGKTIYLASNVEAFKASPGTYELPFHLSLATGVSFLVLNDFNFNETYILKVHKP